MLHLLSSLFKVYGLYNWYQIWIAKYLEKANIDRYMSGQLLKCLLGLVVSTLYLAWIRKENYMGLDISDTNFFSRLCHVHDPFFNNLFGTKPSPQILSNVIHMTWMDWFNCATLGYFGMWLKGHFESIFSFPFLFSLVPFEMYLLYDLISSGMHWHVNGIMYYLLWALVLYHLWHKIRYPKSNNTGKPMGTSMFLMLSAFAAALALDFWFEIGLFNRIFGPGIFEQKDDQKSQQQHNFPPFMPQESQENPDKFRRMANFLREESYWQKQQQLHSKGSRIMNMNRFQEISDSSDDEDEPPVLEDISEGEISVE
ncbi:hypothetical protein FDP41_011615 [Naegleria fowleri]|uniref:Uncharacterized protein n=1 Tax=Naegleria fowleri TaxID=5763 RepID=A0A6A5CBF3_NAEFO|nr:uncharacterized protein FDP41_011615 [Naegleria fowleri]KAF0982685.1 hypothetical protein FDP41_011615 [Naegleria fowleri]CAG4713556.1 unnamed protein product [Naegleria fowleri]